MQGLFNAPPPPPDKRPFLRLAKIAAEQRLQFFILSDRLYGATTHYVDRRTTICLGVEQGCEWCAKGFSPRWSGFLAVSPINHINALLLTLTPGAYHNCPELAAGPPGLRGKVIVCERLGKSSNSPLRVQVQRSEAAIKILNRLPDPDVPAALCRLWSLKEIPRTQEEQGKHSLDKDGTPLHKKELEAQDEPMCPGIRTGDFGPSMPS